MKSFSQFILVFLCVLFILSIEACKKSNELPPSYEQTGTASYYADFFQNRPTASGERYYADSLTAAHKYLPLGTVVQVTNLENDSTVRVLINDRGPYVPNRVIDLSKAAARELEMLEKGTAEVKIKVIEPAKGYTLMDSIAPDRIGK